MKTHALIESMMEKQWKERYDDVVLESKVRQAKIGRGEEVLLGVGCEGDYEELIGRDPKQQVLTPLSRKWVVTDAILLHGSLEEVQSHIPREELWTESSLEKERKQLFKSLDATSRSAASKLYVAFALLSRSASKLELDRLLPEMTRWLMDYAKKRELKVKGISKESGDGYTLSLLDHEKVSPLTKKTEGCSNGDMHRIKQYASLCSAIIYLSAKRNGKGRTLAEVCGAFGTFCSGEKGEKEPLVRPKYSSKAMQEFRVILPGVIAAGSTITATALSDGRAEGGLKPAAAVTPSSPVFTPIKTESRAFFNKGSTSVVSLSSSCTTSSIVPLDTSSNNGSRDTNRRIISNTEDEALADLTSRMARSLDLPPCATLAAVAIAVQCSSDSTTPAAPKSRSIPIRPPIRRGNRKNSLFIQNKGSKRSNGGALLKKGSPDVIAAASILLVCMAGQKMQTLSRQAAKGSSEPKPTEQPLAEPSAALSNPLDDLAEELSSKELSIDTASMKTSISVQSSSNNNATRQTSSEAWVAWNHQPPWHREVSQIEQCTGVSSKTIISYYSNVLHPRRSYFLGVAQKRVDAGDLTEYEHLCPRKRIKTEHGAEESSQDFTSLLRNIATAAPMISLRGL
jgi:hypothetical protein